MEEVNKNNKMNDEEWCIAGEIDNCEPNAEELDTIYKQLERGGTIDLRWKCPGRRAPSPNLKREDNKLNELPASTIKPTKEIEFDFSDDIVLPQIRHKQGTPKSGSKKKTNFDVVINQMRKHGRLSTASANTNNSASGSISGTNSSIG